MNNSRKSTSSPLHHLISQFDSFKEKAKTLCTLSQEKHVIRMVLARSKSINREDRLRKVSSFTKIFAEKRSKKQLQNIGVEAFVFQDITSPNKNKDNLAHIKSTPKEQIAEKSPLNKKKIVKNVSDGYRNPITEFKSPPESKNLKQKILSSNIPQKIVEQQITDNPMNIKHGKNQTKRPISAQNKKFSRIPIYNYKKVSNLIGESFCKQKDLPIIRNSHKNIECSIKNRSPMSSNRSITFSNPNKNIHGNFFAKSTCKELKSPNMILEPVKLIATKDYNFSEKSSKRKLVNQEIKNVPLSYKDKASLFKPNEHIEDFSKIGQSEDHVIEPWEYLPVVREQIIKKLDGETETEVGKLGYDIILKSVEKVDLLKNKETVDKIGKYPYTENCVTKSASTYFDLNTTINDHCQQTTIDCNLNEDESSKKLNKTMTASLSRKQPFTMPISNNEFDDSKLFVGDEEVVNSDSETQLQNVSNEFSFLKPEEEECTKNSSYLNNSSLFPVVNIGKEYEGDSITQSKYLSDEILDPDIEQNKSLTKFDTRSHIWIKFAKAFAENTKRSRNQKKLQRSRGFDKPVFTNDDDLSLKDY